jgi:hypothetical protein
MFRFKHPAQVGENAGIEEAPERTRKSPITAFLDRQYEQLISQMSGECVRINRRVNICTDAGTGELHAQPAFVLGVDDYCEPISLTRIAVRKIDDRRQSRKIPAPVGRPAHQWSQRVQLIAFRKRARIND